MNIEDSTQSALASKLSTAVFYLSVLFFIIGFSFTDVPLGPFWYQQFLPNINNRPISDMTFTDSLTGYIVTPYVADDTCYILKTTDGGNNWNVQLRQPTNTAGGFNRVQFLSQTTGYACGNFLWKTTDAGLNWFNINTSGIFPMNMFVLNIDTIWLIDSDQLVGGVFRTTNGGANWTQQLSLGNQNPDHIYMFNSRIGFISNINNGAPNTRKTTDGGQTWNIIVSNRPFGDMFFVDSLNGWTEWDSVRTTTDGGSTWRTQVLPYSFGVSALFTTHFADINRDTIWLGGGRIIYPNSQARGILYRTTNAGTNWLFQIPDTSIHTGIFSNATFVDMYRGWAYWPVGGVHTTTGGDTTFLSVHQITTEVPKYFKLFQNYPNPFNPTTVIGYQLTVNSRVKLTVFDITGKQVASLVDQKQGAGTYRIDFSGTSLSSGVYFYQLTVNNEHLTEVYRETKKMLLIK